MDCVVRNTIGNNQSINENKNIEYKISEIIGIAILIYVFILFEPRIHSFYLKYCQKIPKLNETQQELLYDILSKNFNKNDLFYNARVLDAKTENQKAVKNFIVTLSQRTTNDNILKNHVNKFKNFTHPSWVQFKELVNLNISKDDRKKIYTTLFKIYLMQKNPKTLDQKFIHSSQKIVENILRDKFIVLQELIKENPTLSGVVLEYWNIK